MLTYAVAQSEKDKRIEELEGKIKKVLRRLSTAP
jgi:hypothetical protein